MMISGEKSEEIGNIYSMCECVKLITHNHIKGVITTILIDLRTH